MIDTRPNRKWTASSNPSRTTNKQFHKVKGVCCDGECEQKTFMVESKNTTSI
jgi:hypothetical protein